MIASEGHGERLAMALRARKGFKAGRSGRAIEKFPGAINGL